MTRPSKRISPFLWCGVTVSATLSILLLLLVLPTVRVTTRVAGFVVQPISPSVSVSVSLISLSNRNSHRRGVVWCSSKNNHNVEEEGDEAHLTARSSSSTADMDDVNAMTDRFKYKVHALMGDYDPVDSVRDDEYQNGNILRAFVKFPTRHTFTVIGKTTAEDTEEEDTDDENAAAPATQARVVQTYVDTVRRIVRETSGCVYNNNSNNSNNNTNNNINENNNNDNDNENTQDDTTTPGPAAEFHMTVAPRGKKFTRINIDVTVESAAMIAVLQQELKAIENTVMSY